MKRTWSILMQNKTILYSMKQENEVFANNNMSNKTLSRPKYFAFRNKCIGRRAEFPKNISPPRSPDLNPIDFFMELLEGSTLYGANRNQGTTSLTNVTLYEIHKV